MFKNILSSVGNFFGNLFGGVRPSTQSANVFQATALPGAVENYVAKNNLNPTTNATTTPATQKTVQSPIIGMSPDQSRFGMSPDQNNFGMSVAPSSYGMSPAYNSSYPNSVPGSSSTPISYYDASRGVMVRSSDAGTFETPVSGFSGSSGTGSTIASYIQPPTSGAQGVTGGRSSYTGLLGSAGGAGPSVFQGGTPDFSNPDDPFRTKKSGVLSNYQLPGPVNGVSTPMFNPITPPVQPRMDLGQMSSTHSVTDLQNTQNSNAQALSSTPASSQNDQAETYNNLNQIASDHYNNTPVPETPVIDTPEQKAFLDSIPQDQQFDVKKTMDSLRSSLGIDTMVASRLDTLKQIDSLNAAMQKITDDVRYNPDLPKGLAARRIQELQRTQKEQLTALTDKLNITNQQIADANDQVNQQFNIAKLQYDQQVQRQSQARETFQLMASSGAIGAFNDGDIQNWATKTGIPASAIKAIVQTAQRPEVKIDGNPKDGYVSITTDKRTGAVKVTPLVGSDVTGGFDRANTLRTEYNNLPETKTANVVQSYAQQAQSGYSQYLAGNEQSGQQVIINALAKIIDPGSVVRQSEFAQTATGQSLLNTAQGLYDQYTKGGQRLSPEATQGLMSTINSLNAGYIRNVNQKVDYYRNLAVSAHANPDYVASYIQTPGIIDSSGKIDPKAVQEGDVVIDQSGSAYMYKNGSWNPTVQSSSNPQTMTDIDKSAQAISKIESGGSYTAIGPANAKGQKAYGKYQVMDFNIPAWTSDALGYSMTPQQFLQSPDAQEAVFKHQFQKYIDAYGSPQAAAAVWLGGVEGLSNGNASDVNGTTVNKYVSMFNNYYNEIG